MRLIDADVLIEAIKNMSQRYCDCKDCDGRGQIIRVSEVIDIAKNEVPTAYSVNKVVEELEEIRKKDVCDYLYCDVCAYTDKCSGVTDQSNNLKWDKAIEIVNQGGVSDDVCEWKLKDTCYTSSIKHYDALPTSIVKTFTSCPYCGKKIKVVE